MTRQRIRRTVIAISAVLFPVTFFYISPVLILMAAGERVVSGSFIAFGAMFVTSLVFGRAFCGWICPGGGIAECSSKIREKRIKRRWIDAIKYIYWPVWLGLIVFTAVRAGGLSRVDVLYQTWHGISVSNAPSALMAAAVILVIVLLTVVVGRRGFCHTLCWMAPFMVLGTWIRDRLRLPGLRLHATPETCVSCAACTRGCPMSLDVHETMVLPDRMSNRECILCGHCADVCPTHTIRLSFRRAGSKRPAA